MKEKNEIVGIIETYYDPKGIKDGIKGCMIARIKGESWIRAAGIDLDSAIDDLLLTLKSFGRPHERKNYDIEKMEG